MSHPLAVALSVVSSLLVGLVLGVAPWTALWDSNRLVQPVPWLRELVLSPVVRGAVSGLGVVNLLVAWQELREALSGRDREH
jgi:hypothetical protein